MSEINIPGLRRDPVGFFSPLLERLFVLSERQPHRYREDSLRQEVPDDRPGFRCDFVVDPDAYPDTDLVGGMSAHFAQTSQDEFSVWIAMSPDRVVDLRPNENFKFGPGFTTKEFGPFMREFVKHPNHGVMLAFYYQYIMSLDMEAGFRHFYDWVHQVRQYKRNLLLAVMARARVPDLVETILLEHGVQLQRPGME